MPRNRPFRKPLPAIWQDEALKSSVSHQASHTFLTKADTSQHNTRSQYIKNYGFDFDFGAPWGPCSVTMTAVLGHLTGLEFTPENKNWSHPPPESLFSAPVVTVVPQVRLLALGLDCLGSDGCMCRTRKPLPRTLSGRLGTANSSSSGLIVIERESTLEKKLSMLLRKVTIESPSNVPPSATSNERKPGLLLFHADIPF